MKHLIFLIVICALGELLGCQSPTTDKKTNDVQPTPSQSWKANYDWVEPHCENSVVKVRKNHKFGLVDPNGKVLIPVEYEDIESGVSLSLYWRWAKKDGKYGYLDENGAVVIPFIYDGAKTFSGLMAAVKKGGKWGYIDTEGTVIIPFAYDELDEFGMDDYCAAKKNGKWGYIDKNNKVIIPFIYDEVEDSDLKYIRVVKDGKEGVIDFNRKTVIPIDFYVINLLGDDAMRIFPTKETTIETCFLLDSLGNCIDGCEYIPEYYKTHKLFYP